MPIDELSEGLLRALFRLVGQFIVEIVGEIILHKSGWLFLRAVTFGRYPPPEPRQYNEGLVIAVGIVVWVAGVVIVWALL